MTKDLNSKLDITTFDSTLTSLEDEIAKKATKNVATTSANGLMSSSDKTKLDGIATGANKYTHPTTSGNKHIPSGGASGQYLKWSADGTAVWSTIPTADPLTAGTGITISNNTISANIGTSSSQVAAGNHKHSNYATTDHTHSDYATTDHTHSDYAAKSHTHNYAGSTSAGGAATSALTCTGNSATATKLATARTINGTSFDGSGNITTANWGTARNITIGSTTKSVNGSGNVSWSLSEIGAAASNHTHSYLPLSGGTMSGVLTMNGNGIKLQGSGDKAGIGIDNTDVYIGNTAGNWLRLKTDLTLTYGGRTVPVMESDHRTVYFGQKMHLGTGSSEDIFICNTTANKYLSMKDDGRLTYGGKLVVTFNTSSATHSQIRAGSGLSGESGYITFTW